MTLSDQVRRAIEKCGMSRYRLAQESGIAASVLCRFMAGQGMSSDNLDRLAPVLGLRLTTTKKRTAKSKGR